MVKKLLIGLMCVGFMTLLTTESNAGWPTYGGGGGGWGSVDCWSLWKSFGNTLRDSVVPPIIDCTIYPVTVETMCKNPADNIGGGVVFDLRDRAFSGEGYVLAEDLNAKGQYDSYIGFTNETLFDAFGYGTTDDICDEFNGSGNEQSAWSLVPEADGGYIHILKLFMAFRAYVDIDGDGFIDVTPVEDVHLACRAPEGANFDEPGDYYCTELCDKTKKTDCTEDPYTYLEDPNFTFFD